MKKSTGISFLLLSAVCLAACNDADTANNDSEEEDTNVFEDNENNEEISFDAEEVNNNDNENNEEDEEDVDEEAEQIVEQAIEAEEERGAYYIQTETSVTNEEEVFTEEEFWYFPSENGSSSERRETLDQDGDIEYYVQEEDESQFFTEGSDTIHVLQLEDETEDSESRSTLSHYMESFEIEYGGEEEVNGFDTHHVIFTNEEESLEHWFTQDDYFSVRTLRTSINEEEEEEETTEIDVLDYDLDPEEDDELFQLDDAAGDDVNYEDIDDEEFFEDEEDADEDAHG